MPSIRTIQRAIAILRIKHLPITTINIIITISGGYLIAYNTPPAYSINACFGKFLSKNHTQIGIRFIRSAKVQIGNDRTTTAIWA